MTYMPPASPANIDASVTSLSAGSLTTVARADHIHTLSKVPVLLGSTTLGSATNTVTFSSISQSFSVLRLVALANVVDTSTYYSRVDIRVNSLSTSIYYDGYSGTLTTQLSSVNHATGNFFSSTKSPMTCDIYGYATSQYKLTRTNYNINNSSAGFAQHFNGQVSVIATTSAITSITLTQQFSYNFTSGSIFLLYGIP